MNAIFIEEQLSSGRTIAVLREKPRPAPVIEIAQARTKARDSALIYAENRLAVWSRWAKEHRDSIGYPTVSALYRAMQVTKVGIVRAGAGYPKAIPDGEGNQTIHYPINADGHATRSLRPVSVGEIPEAVAEVDRVVAKLPKNLHKVIVADYFTYGAIEDRCKRTPWRRARYSQLLESAKYAVYVALMA